MSWAILYFNEALQQSILDFPDGIQARFIHLTERMQVFGSDLGMPHTRSMGNGLFEMRLKSKEGIARVFYCTLSGRRIVMLHAYIKKSEKAPANELKTARTRMKEVQGNAQT